MDERKPKGADHQTEETHEHGDMSSNNIYDDDSRQEMLENDEITAAEEGFMRGWEGTVEGDQDHKKDGHHKDSLSVELVKEQYQED